MREILFRGKRPLRDANDKGEWAYGSLLYNANENPELAKIATDEVDENGLRLLYVVDAFTVGQYTGLTDSKGNKVFEGDILSFTYDVLGGEWKGQIVFGNPHSRYTWGWEIVPITQTDFDTDILLWFDMEESGAICEVIGNIHDKGGEEK